MVRATFDHKLLIYIANWSLENIYITKDTVLRLPSMSSGNSLERLSCLGFCIVYPGVLHINQGHSWESEKERGGGRKNGPSVIRFRIIMTNCVLWMNKKQLDAQTHNLNWESQPLRVSCFTQMEPPIVIWPVYLWKWERERMKLSTDEIEDKQFSWMEGHMDSLEGISPSMKRDSERTESTSMQIVSLSGRASLYILKSWLIINTSPSTEIRWTKLGFPWGNWKDERATYRYSE